MQNNWHRWYDSALGQWLNEDPLGFGAGDDNLRRYVSNGPSYGTDPDGHGIIYEIPTGPPVNQAPVTILLSPLLGPFQVYRMTKCVRVTFGCRPKMATLDTGPKADRQLLRLP